MHSAGRVADVDRLGLENAGVEFGRHGVLVDDRLRSVSNPRFWAAGDAAALGTPLTPIASRQGSIVAAGILGEDATFDGRATPSVVFGDPPLAAVGMRAEEAAGRGAEVTVKRGDISAWFARRGSAGRMRAPRSSAMRRAAVCLGPICWASTPRS